MGLFDRVTRFNRRALTGVPAGPSPQAHAAWMMEEIKATASVQQYAGPHQAGMNVTGETNEMARAYRTMLKEPAVYAPLMAKTFAVASLDAQVTPDDEDDPVQRDAAGFVAWSVRKATGGWPRLLMEVMLTAQIDGYSVTEKVFDTVEPGHPKYPSFWTLKAAKAKDTYGIRLKLDPYRNVLAVQALAAGQGGKPLDPRDFIIYSHLPIFQSPFGLSVLRPVYRMFNLIGAAIKLRSILLENFSGPFLALKLGDSQRMQASKAALADARSRGFIILDREDEIDVMNLATSAPDQFQQSIEDLRKEASLALRGAYLQSLESSSPQGDSKTHKTQTELFDWYLATSVCAALQDQLVPDLVEPNYGHKGGRPEISLGGIDPGAVSAELDKLAKVKALGVGLSKNQIRRISGAEAERDADDGIPGDGPPPGPGGPPGGQPGGNPLASANFSDRRPGLFDGEPGGPGVAAFAATWSAATGSKGQPGFKSDGGQFRVQLPKGAQVGGGESAKPAAPTAAAPTAPAAPAAPTPTPKPVTKRAATAAAQLESVAKVQAAFAEPHKLTAASAADLSGHLATLSVAQLKGLAADLTLKAGKTKAALADVITAHAQGVAAGVAASASRPGTPPPPPAPTPKPKAAARPVATPAQMEAAKAAADHVTGMAAQFAGGGFPKASLDAGLAKLDALDGPQLLHAAKLMNADAGLTAKTPRAAVLKRLKDGVTIAWRTSDNVNHADDDFKQQPRGFGGYAPPIVAPKPPADAAPPPQPAAAPAAAKLPPAPVGDLGARDYGDKGPPKPTDPARQAHVEQALDKATTHLRKFAEFRDGLIELPRLYHEAKKAVPDLSPEEFHSVVAGIGSSYRGELHVLNETRTAEEPALSFQKNGRLYHYLRLPKTGLLPPPKS